MFYKNPRTHINNILKYDLLFTNTESCDAEMSHQIKKKKDNKISTKQKPETFISK